MGKKRRRRKGKKRRKKEKFDPLTYFPEVKRLFYELYIEDAKRKIERLGLTNGDLEVKNEELSANIEEMDEQRSPEVEEKKTIWQNKVAELEETLEEKRVLEQRKEEQITNFRERIMTLDKDYRTTHEDITNEIKTLTGRLNSLEEYKLLREDLWAKYKRQEEEMEEMIKAHLKLLNAMERKFIAEKNAMIKDFERRLLDLANDYHDAAEDCIANTIKRCIRENIAIDHELDLIMEAHCKLLKEKITFLDSLPTHKEAFEYYKQEEQEMFQKCNLQKRILQGLLVENDRLEELMDRVTEVQQAAFEVRETHRDAVKMIGNLKHKLKMAEQDLHVKLCEKITITQDEGQECMDKAKMQELISHSRLFVKAIIEIKYEPISEDDPFSDAIIASNLLLETLLRLFKRANDPKLLKIASTETVLSLQGHLQDFMPKQEPVEEIEEEVDIERHSASIDFDVFSEGGAFEPFGEEDTDHKKNDEKSGLSRKSVRITDQSEVKTISRESSVSSEIDDTEEMKDLRRQSSIKDLPLEEQYDLPGCIRITEGYDYESDHPGSRSSRTSKRSISVKAVPSGDKGGQSLDDTQEVSVSPGRSSMQIKDEDVLVDAERKSSVQIKEDPKSEDAPE